MYNFFVSEGVIKGKKKNVLPSKSPIVREAPSLEQKSASTDASPVVAESAALPEVSENSLSVEESSPEPTPSVEQPVVEEAVA